MNLFEIIKKWIGLDEMILSDLFSFCYYCATVFELVCFRFPWSWVFDPGNRGVNCGADFGGTIMRACLGIEIMGRRSWFWYCHI